LFECFLHYFEEVWSYSKSIEFWNEQSDEFIEISEKTKVVEYAETWTRL